MTAPIYFLNFFLIKIYDFFRHWYVGGFSAWVNATVGLLERFDRRLALRITVRHLFSPLYQEWNLAGFILGFIFRSIRAIAAVSLYGLVILASFILYVAWATLPVYFIYKIIKG